MKRFFFATAGLMCLTIAVAIGYSVGQQAHAQGAPISGLSYDGGFGGTFVITDIGDVYWRKIFETYDGGEQHPVYRDDDPAYQLFYVGNMFSTPPVPVESSTWGSIKSQLDGN